MGRPESVDVVSVGAVIVKERGDCSTVGPTLVKVSGISIVFLYAALRQLLHACK